MDFKRWILINGSISVSLVLILAFLVFFTGRDIARRADLIRSQRRDLALQLQVFESLASLRSGAERADKLLPSIQGILPAKEQLIEFPKKMELAAKSNQLGFGFRFDAETGGTDKEPGTDSFILTSYGRYQNFTKFLKFIEDSKYFVGFNSFDLNRRAENNFEILIKGKVFSQ